MTLGGAPFDCVGVFFSLFFLDLLFFDFSGTGVAAAVWDEGGAADELPSWDEPGKTGSGTGVDLVTVLGGCVSMLEAGAGVLAALLSFFLVLGFFGAGLETSTGAKVESVNDWEVAGTEGGRIGWGVRGAGGAGMGVSFRLVEDGSDPRSGLPLRSVFCFLDFLADDLVSS